MSFYDNNYHDQAAEQAIIAYTILMPEQMTLAMTQLTRDDFDLELAGEMFERFANAPPGADARRYVTQQYMDEGRIDECSAFMLEVTSDTRYKFYRTPLHASHYIQVVKQRRNDRIVRAALSECLESDDPSQNWRDTMTQLSGLTTSCGDAALYGDSLTELLDELSQDTTRLEFGLPAIDDAMGGFPQSSMNLVVAPTGGGKSAFLMNFAVHQLQNGSSGLWFSLEMPRRELHQRMVASIAEIHLSKLNSFTKLSDQDRSEFLRVTSQIAGWRFNVIDDPSLTIEAAWALCSAHKARHGLDFVLLDYLGLFSTKHFIKQRDERLGHIAQVAKAIAMDLDCVVMSAHQLNRDGAKRGDATINDIEGSSKIANAADTVLIIQPGATNEMTTETPVEIKCTKGRSVGRFQSDVKFIGKYQKFVPLAYDMSFAVS